MFRHSLASDLLRQGGSLDEIGELLRHQSPDTTAIYAKVDVTALHISGIAVAGRRSMKQLRKGIRDYLMMRRGLGFKLAQHEAGLEEFASFLERKRSAHITVELALEWATLPAHHQPCQWAARLTIVRGFARYWSATDPSTEVPPLGLLPYRPNRAQPYFYSDQEIRATAEGC